jgi:hypothetical protein
LVIGVSLGQKLAQARLYLRFRHGRELTGAEIDALMAR